MLPGVTSALSAQIERSLAEYRRVTGEHLCPADAECFLSLLLPAVHLVAATGTEPVVARLGGEPVVPADFEWPLWAGHGPLSFVTEIDLDALTAAGAPVPGAPADGRLLAFYFDGGYDGLGPVIDPWQPESQAGARLIHLRTARADGSPRQAPPKVPRFDPVDLTARGAMTHPGWEHHRLKRAFAAEALSTGDWLAQPVNGEAFLEALGVLQPQPVHQLGGWASPAQGPVELEAAEVVLGEDASDAAIAEEAENWAALLQIDSDLQADMMWGDMGALYWLARTGSPSGDLARTAFTWQCG